MDGNEIVANLKSGLTYKDFLHYKDYVLPKLYNKLLEVDDSEFHNVYASYLKVMRLVAVDDFHTFNTYLEIDEVKDDPNKSFYFHRKKHISEIIEALNDIEIYDKYDKLLISTPPRIGKMQPLDSGVLTPEGWTTMGSLKVGDKVVGSNGNSYNVTGIFPHYGKDVYEVKFDDGTVVECGLEHLWTVQTRDDRRNGTNRTISTEEMIGKLYLENGKRKNYSIEYVNPVEFCGKLDDDDIAPYIMGCLIGDGSFVGGVKFTNVDDELLDKFKSLLPNCDKMNRISDTISYGISKKEDSRNEKGHLTPSHTLRKIREYRLDGKTSECKFIPDKYLRLSVENRLELLRGLMDTDGYVVKGNMSYCEYTTVSEELCDDVVELVRSLGGRATVHSKIGTYVKNGKIIKCKKVYRISFNMGLNPFSISRKRIRFSPRKTGVVKYITSITKTRNTDCRCIMIDAPDHLYVTDGYNLTHNTTIGIRFLCWIIGRYPEETQLATSYSEAITRSFYIGSLETIINDRYKEIFPDAPLVNQNAKSLEIWLKSNRRYSSIGFIPMGGSMTGRAEASRYLYMDDLVSGIEEAMSPSRLEKLWEKYSINATQRKKNNAKEIMIATRWSVHDPLSKVEALNEDDPRCKSIKISCYDEDGESNFNFFGGFTTEFYKGQENIMDELSFNAIYKQEPIEREGILYNKEDLQYYYELPDYKPDTIISVCDSKNLGTDSVSAPIGYVYGDLVYIDDVVFNNGLPEITKELVARKWVEHGVIRGDVELNNGGNYFADDVNKLIKEKGGKTSIRIFFSSNNKLTKIITYSDIVKKHFVFRHPSTYSQRGEYSKFMKETYTFTQTGKVKHDDAVDTLAMLAQLYTELSGMNVKFLNRRELGI